MIICSPQLGISPRSNLGGEVYDRELLTSLADQGVDIEIILPRGKEHREKKRWHITYLPVPFVYPPWLFNILVLPYLFILYFKKPFSVLRVHSIDCVGPAAVFFQTLFPKVKLVLNYHHSDDSFLEKIALRSIIQRFNLVIVDSANIRNELITSGRVSKDKIIAFPGGIDQRYRPLAKSKQLEKLLGIEDKRVLLYLGQLIARKNVAFLFKVLQLLPSSWVLVVCGDGPIKIALEDKASALGIEKRVIFTGRVPEEDKLNYYNLADVFVYPSLKEGFGLSILEAMACGKLVVASDIPAFREIVPKESGRLVHLDPSEWCKVIRDLATGKKIYNSLGEQAVMISRKYNWRNTARNFLRALK